MRLIADALKALQDEKPDANDRAVFASKFEAVATLARHSLSQAVGRIVADTEGLAEFTPHDLRRTGATLVQAARLPVDYVKALLNHNDKGVTSVYARWHMFEEKREAVLAIKAATSFRNRSAGLNLTSVDQWPAVPPIKRIQSRP